jgi:hypothetical protein
MADAMQMTDVGAPGKDTTLPRKFMHSLGRSLDVDRKPLGTMAMLPLLGINLSR